MERAKIAILRVKNLLSRNTNSPFQEDLPPPSSGGLLFHHHAILPPHAKPNQYVQFALTGDGKLVSYPDPPIGYLTCSCKLEHHDELNPKLFSFVKSCDPANLTEEHIISSKFVLQSLTQSQKLSSDTSYLFFRLDGNEPENQENLKDHIEVSLRQLTQGVDREYEALYSSIFQATAPSLSPVVTNPHRPVVANPHRRPIARTRIASSSTSRSSSISPEQGATAREIQAEIHSNDAPPPVQAGAASNKISLQFAVLIFSVDRQELDFTLPCSRYISESVQSQLVSKISKGIRSRQAPCVAIYIVRDSESWQPRYQLCASTISTTTLLKLRLNYMSQRCQGVTYTVVPVKVLLQHEVQQTYCKALAQTLRNESVYRWFKRVLINVLQGSLFFACNICNATFEEKSAVDRHTQKAHGRQLSSPESSDLETAAIAKLTKPGGQLIQSQQPSRQNSDRHHHDHQDHHDHHDHHDLSGQHHHHHQDFSPTTGQSYRSNNPTSHQSTASILSKEIYIPSFLSEADCPKEYEIFWNLKGQSVPPSFDNVGGASHGGKWICPKFPRQMLTLEKVVNHPSLLEEETVAWAKTYRYMFQQERFSSIEKVDLLQVHCYNDPKRLQSSNRSKAFDELRKAAPTLESKSLQSLSEAALENFFFQARIFTLNHHIPVESFPDYLLTPVALGNEIYTRIKETLQGYPEYRFVLRRFTVYLENIVRSLLPAQEPYTQCEQRIISEHRVYLLSSHPSIDYTRTKLHADASELLTRSPHYVQTRENMSVEQKRSHIDGLKTNLLAKIVAETPFEADLYRLVTMDREYRKLEEIPFQILLDRLQNLILADKRGEAAVQANVVKWGVRSRSSLVKPGKESRKVSRSPEPSPPTSPHSASQRSRSRSKSPHPNIQPLCDNCSKFNLPEKLCKVNKHCRMKGHQPHFKGETQFYQAVQSSNEAFVLKDACTKCSTTPTGSDFKWLRNSQNSQPVNQVFIPPSFFNTPYQLHPQSIQDLAKQSQGVAINSNPHYHHPPPPVPPHQPPPTSQPSRHFGRANSPRR